MQHQMRYVAIEIGMAIARTKRLCFPPCCPKSHRLVLRDHRFDRGVVRAEYPSTHFDPIFRRFAISCSRSQPTSSPPPSFAALPLNAFWALGTELRLRSPNSP